MKFSEFLIEKEIKWAIEDNSIHALKNYSHRDDFIIVWLNPTEVINNTDPQMRVDSTDSANHIGNRMHRVISHVNDHQYLDPPIIAYDRYTASDYKIIVDDGRHRIAAMKKLGIDKFPAYIMKDDLPLLKKVIKVKTKE